MDLGPAAQIASIVGALVAAATVFVSAGRILARLDTQDKVLDGINNHLAKLNGRVGHTERRINAGARLATQKDVALISALKEITDRLPSHPKRRRG